ncbi:MAG: glycosyltransferase [Actinomycetota bacterium]
MAAEILLTTVAFLLGWTYIFYPAMVIMLARLKKKRKTLPEMKRMTVPDENTGDETLPFVSVVMSLYNEEKIIEAKILSMLGSDYPSEKLEFLIGSDGSTDSTDSLVMNLASANGSIRLIRCSERKGKPAMLNHLASLATGEILVVTDANVIFTPQTVRRLSEGFKDSLTGLCDATVSPDRTNSKGITRQENLYGRFETNLKRAEGDLWGAMPGPYGGCYAIRRYLFPALPENILVDDLYAGLSVLGENHRSFNIPDAVVYEDTQPEMMEQFRRRIRIAAGSFQNLFHFGPFPSRRLSVILTFVSHKIMRWLTPLLILLFFMTTVILSARSDFYFYLTAFQLIFIILPALDLVLYRKEIKTGYLRYVTHFLLMNAALAAGFVKAIRGVENGIWEPTKRV